MTGGTFGVGSPSISVIVPVYNNESSLPELHRRLTAVLSGTGMPYEVVFVDDGSKDRSGEILGGLAAAGPSTLVVSFSRNFGQHPAIHAGMSAARGSVIVLMDADLEDSPEDIPVLLAPMIEDPTLEIVFSTFDDPEGPRKRLSSAIFHRVFSRLSRTRVPRNLGTFRAFSAKVRDALLEYPERSAVYGPLMSQIGFSSVTVEVSRSAPVGRATSYNLRKRVSLAVSSLIYYGSALPTLVLTAGTALVVLSSGYLAVVVGAYALGQRALPAGTVLLLSVSLLTSGVLMLSVGVLTIYAYQIFKEVLGRPRYHVAARRGSGLP